jgi:hypothetical protein
VDTFQIKIWCVACTKHYSLDSKELKENKAVAIGLTNNVMWGSFFLDK